MSGNLPILSIKRRKCGNKWELSCPPVNEKQLSHFGSNQRIVRTLPWYEKWLRFAKEVRVKNLVLF